MDRNKILEQARGVLQYEIEGLKQLQNGLNDSIVEAIDRIHTCTGRVIVSGMGKAGLIGQKIAATFASTGTPAMSIHPAEAVHGDLGMIRKEDLMLLLSNSGQSEEVLRLVPFLHRIGCPILSMTRNRDSELARQSHVVLALGDLTEACPLRLAPSTSTTAMLALGDVLALTVLELRGFTEKDFAELHPAGALGLKLMKVDEIMRTGDRCPLISPDQTVKEAVEKIKQARGHMVIVVENGNALAGVFTLGDFGRAWTKNAKIGDKTVCEVRIYPCKKIESGKLVADALKIFDRHPINALPVVDSNNHVLGMVDIQDISRRV